MSRVTLVGLLLCAVSGPVFAQDENPAVVVPPPTAGGVYKAAVQRFFDLGGASLQAVQVAERCNELGVPLNPELMFQYPTVAELETALATTSPLSTAGAA